MDDAHQLRISPAQFSDGFIISSNGRAWGMSRAMLQELVVAAAFALETGKPWQNYEDPPPRPLPSTGLLPPSKPRLTLDQALDLL